MKTLAFAFALLALFMVTGQTQVVKQTVPSPNTGTITPTAITAVTGSFSGSVTASSVTVQGVLVSTASTAERVAFRVNPTNGESSFGLAPSSTTLMSRRLTVGFDPNAGAGQGWYNTGTSKTSALMQTVANDADFQLFNAAGAIGMRLIGGSSLNSYINNGANFGIATADPATKLDVGGAAQFGSGATKSTFTATGFWQPVAKTRAQVDVLVPAAGDASYIDCTDCTLPGLCRSTGTLVAQWRKVESATVGCGTGN